MKIIIVSDTHGRVDEFINRLKDIENVDLIIHLGDYVEDGEKIQREFGINTVIVKGNGDYSNQKYEDEILLEIEGKRIFITHGHNYHIRYSLDNLLYRAEEEKADIVLFGHTHVPLILNKSGMKIMNPGSPTYPRGNKRENTFGIIEMNETINMSIEKV